MWECLPRLLDTTGSPTRHQTVTWLSTWLSTSQLRFLLHAWAETRLCEAESYVRCAGRQTCALAGEGDATLLLLARVGTHDRAHRLFQHTAVSWTARQPFRLA